MPLHAERRAFASVQLLGGVAVLSSYAWGLTRHADIATQLWGTIEPGWIPWYSSCMPFAAVGYLAASAYLLRSAKSLRGCTLAFTLFLSASAMWMPLSLLALLTHDRSLTPLIQFDLAVAAVACLWIARHLWTHAEGRRGQVALLGWAALCWQTVFLDALVWPRFFVIS
jgi:hypothetical protein